MLAILVMCHRYITVLLSFFQFFIFVFVSNFPYLTLQYFLFIFLIGFIVIIMHEKLLPLAIYVFLFGSLNLALGFQLTYYSVAPFSSPFSSFLFRLQQYWFHMYFIIEGCSILFVDIYLLKQKYCFIIKIKV
ncbi:hypothetical protein EDEG_01905 [Edhazardia aedis USNM 41457]|uniref:Uncharacterized protein n=1 Tax=Edhazardia aedis (strain USNM 41457) TaxID=1003232 RepID=J8ZVW5_EDHAE|nr:hypothetical protein EDEG_01905 [Edhazardia aedis USNM 41457]|eukprot:EJW03813.1 hypothetical protein EDEG_01905 [Edhazardia aedis USNM 41457]